MKNEAPLVWVNRNPDEAPGPIESSWSVGLPGFMGPPGLIVNIKVPRIVRLMRFWGRWKRIAIDMKELYEQSGDTWPPKPDPRYEDTSRFLEIQLY